MKSRGCYETPGGTILLKARRAMELYVFPETKQVKRIVDAILQNIYDGLWWSNDRLVCKTDR